ncbi:hypothetical protein [Ammoniphilus sp. CFH 90114]|uniref:hypothetical protein n=1 Tax=Ammoniphilus sp. CFH 90114 TaxID=2493665 RepID=UPI00100F904D|nr:hypothetical protein [Ammoniphilus sp. CFH 90114]RXT03603.1 hypothetical protein EIZ39_23530 [Ammoniphilus sp. CFH 90114]
MLDLGKLEDIHPDIEAVSEVVHHLKARVDGKEIHIQILKNQSGHFFYELSHAYRGADHADPRLSEGNRFATVEEAARGALLSATMVYRSTDEGGSWVRNESFYN